MANPSILYTNLSTYTFAASAGTNTSFPLTNLNNYMASSYWSGSNSTKAQLLVIDIGSTQDVTDVIVDGANLQSWETTTFQYANNFAFDSGVTNLGTVPHLNDTPNHVSFASVNKRYFALKFDSQGTGQASPRVGNIFIGTPFEFTTPYDSAGKFDDAEYVTSNSVTVSGQTRDSQMYGGRMVYDVAFSLQDITLKNAFKTFFRTVRGPLIPWYWIDMDGTIRYMNCTQDYCPVTSVAYNLFNIESFVIKTNQAIY
jgi:hypothetical protein